MSKKDNETTYEASLKAASWRCIDPNLGDLLSSYLIDDLTEDDAEKFKKHLRECTKCTADNIRLNAAFRVLKANPAKYFG